MLECNTSQSTMRKMKNDHGVLFCSTEQPRILNNSLENDQSKISANETGKPAKFAFKLRRQLPLKRTEVGLYFLSSTVFALLRIGFCKMLENLLDQSMPKEIWYLSNSLAIHWENVAEAVQTNNSWTVPVGTENNKIENGDDDKNTDESRHNNSIRRLMDIKTEPPQNTIWMNSRRSQRTFSESSSNSEVNTCAYCRNLKYPYDGHTKHCCPVLASLSPCNICGAEGKDNHTATHCPLQMKTVLDLKPEYLMRYNRRRHDSSPV